jgi:hypothetical protein
MSGRPWLEALKVMMRERSADTHEAPKKISKTLPLEGCERCKSLADGATRAMDTRIAEKVRGSWEEEERNLIAASWQPKERDGLLIWANPETGFYYSQEVALHLLKR